MGFWQKIFGRMQKEERASEEDWDKIVYARDEVDFKDEEQRSRYIVNCLEQIAEATKEMNLLTGEYGRVTSYLTDIEEVESLPDKEKEELERIAHKLSGLEQEVQRYRGRENRMSDAEYYKMRGQEAEVETGIGKLRESERYAGLIKRDLRKLDSERQAYEYRRTELRTMLINLRGMATIFLTALVICVLMLLVLQFAFEMDVMVGYFLSVGAAAIAITVLCVKFMDGEREVTRVEKAINRLIQLQNTVKIRYVNNSQLLEYLYIKYNTDSADKLQKLWDNYQQEKEERKQYAEAEAKKEYYQKELMSKLSNYRIETPERFMNQSAALCDKREMVEIRHELILQRQALRKQLDYNNDVAETARKEIMDVARKYPAYTQEILDMVEKYDVQ
ncbi:MAG: hypothetical protein NC094_05080 [Bacteroidales bacterium]|nr:hypothetical protein [Lachnoclostridium sp.]MCM1384275.1 hypothetical protein [Lachnoclostridium sp.]MCM1464774.1 hypothetical protein [Bacteroidales bacterium]